MSIIKKAFNASFSQSDLDAKLDTKVRPWKSAVYFDGVSDYLTLANVSSTIYGGNFSFLWEGVFEPSALNNHIPLIGGGRGTGSYNPGTFGLTYNPNLSQLAACNEITTGTRELTTTYDVTSIEGLWCSVLMTLNTSTRQCLIYLNGSLIIDYTFSALTLTATTTLRAMVGTSSGGTADTGRIVKGFMTQCAIYGFLLTPAQISARYISGLWVEKTEYNGGASECHLWHTFDEGFGTSIGDRTLNGNTGTLTGCDHTKLSL